MGHKLRWMVEGRRLEYHRVCFLAFFFKADPALLNFLCQCFFYYYFSASLEFDLRNFFFYSNKKKIYYIITRIVLGNSIRRSPYIARLHHSRCPPTQRLVLVINTRLLIAFWSKNTSWMLSRKNVSSPYWPHV